MSPSHPDDMPHGTGEVGDAYHAADFGDSPPAHVDTLILATARRAATHRPQRYLPSLAMAATVLLALGLVLRLTVPGRETTQPASTPAARSAPALMEEAEVRRSLPTEPSAPAADAAAPLRPSPTAANEAPPAASEAVANASRAAAQGLAAEADTAACAALRGVEPATWLACIRTRLEAGEPEEARAELAIFTLTYPDYVIPAELAAPLGP